MTTELEQEFFKVFGIESKIYKTDGRDIDDNGDVCSWYIEEIYLEITDRRLLEMICIILNTEGLLTINTEGNIADIKDFVLRFLIGKVNKNNPYCHYKTKNKIKHQIQQLFKEEE